MTVAGADIIMCLGGVQAIAAMTFGLFTGKPAVFEAPAIHGDEIAALPAGASALAGNDMGLQAATFSFRRATFWGVQYHPEYDYLDLAAAAERYGATLVAEGLFHDRTALDQFALELRQLHSQPGDAALLWKHGLGPAMANEALRRLEIRNWLEQQVLPRYAAHA